MLQHAHREAANDVDKQDQDAGYRITAHELAGTVHGTVKIRFPGYILAPPERSLLVDNAGVQVGVDRHLLAGHGVEGEPCRDFRHAPGALGDHHEIDNHQNGEDHDTHRVTAPHHEFAEGLDHLARGARTVVPFEQHHPR